jgi:hypothetical protein
MNSAGHLFIVRGDLTKIACDAWLLPTDRFFNVNDGWRLGLEACGIAWQDGGPAFRAWERGELVRRLPSPTGKFPAVWAARSGTDRPDVRRYVDVAVRFVDEAAAACTKDPHAFTKAWRSTRLLALPVVGTRDGGGYTEAVRILGKLIPAMGSQARQRGIDVALVCLDANMYAAAQRVRQEAADAGWESALGLDGIEQAQNLARLAQNGRLVLFLGAGASIGAGLPSWSGLIKKLGGAKLDSKAAEETFSKLSVLDQATLVERWLDTEGQGRPARSRRSISARLKSLFDIDRVALVHALLAPLPVDEIVTTNYDKLFELASESVGIPVSVLPRDPKKGTRRWLLKMHGCIDHPDDIVLTREDYLRYEQHRAALAGIVQALLITKHMLFVGFSLNDDNFHRIIDSVKRAIRPEGTGDAKAEPFGTVLFVTDDAFVRELWQRDLSAYSLRRAPDAGVAKDETAATQAAARRLEILLDYLGAATVEPAFMGEWRFAELLKPSEQRLRRMLVELFEEFPDAGTKNARDTLLAVRALADRLGVV